MTELKDRVEAILELDKNRTQGDWWAHLQYMADEVVIFINQSYGLFATRPHGIVCSFLSKDSDGNSLAYKENAQFIEAAPKMVELIKDQQSLIEELEKREKKLVDALKEITKDDCYGMGIWTPYHTEESMYKVAKAALESIKGA